MNASDFASLHRKLQGELLTDNLVRSLYATDASEYQEQPLAVAFPETDRDVQELIRFAQSHHIGLIPRTAGTSLAGQVVGNGIVIDFGRCMNRVLSLDVEKRRVRVQPGVVRNELNKYLMPYGLFFAPETSTANWAMIGGMVGNNSCGSNSIAYGTTRDHLHSARGFLADSSEVTFGPCTTDQMNAICKQPAASLENRLYREMFHLLSQEATRQLIAESFPKPEVTRRNTGYALDALMHASCFSSDYSQDFNFCRLLAGSEGTLFIGVEYELSLIPQPPPGALVCIHCTTVSEALESTVLIMQCLQKVNIQPTACELIDQKILDCTKNNLEQSRNRRFVIGDPGAVLVVEVRNKDPSLIKKTFNHIETQLRNHNLGYAYPRLFGDDGNCVWELRRAGQGLVNNLPGDNKPREIVEDTAVAVQDLPAYIHAFDLLLQKKYGVDCVHYAHAGAGELHLRPLFNLHTKEGLKMFRDVATDVAHLVKKFRGSLSGEHGDGRLRGEFIPTMVGTECFKLFEHVKHLFDPLGILNPGKIIQTPPMDSHLRVNADAPTQEQPTTFQFRDTGGIVRAAEKCTGVGQCRKTHLIGGTMCPSYMATRDEQHSTRARANILRQALTHHPDQPWSQPEIAEVMDLCLSCKACKSECPSNVDMARMKAEWEQQFYDINGVPLRSKILAQSYQALRCASHVPYLYNFLTQTPGIASCFKKALGLSPYRSMPKLPQRNLARWLKARRQPQTLEKHTKRIYLLCDEFTSSLDTAIGIAAIELIERLGYEIYPIHTESGRSQLSKGFVRQARELAIRNVERLSSCVSDEEPLVGIEPSALLTFRDEYPDLVPTQLYAAAKLLATRTFLLEEFLVEALHRGHIHANQFTQTPCNILFHAHCHQKALSSANTSLEALAIPSAYTVTRIQSGCCGMAGAFGYEREHYDLSMEIAELVLLPTIRDAPPETIIAATGTSCRHQIKDGTGRIALHPAQILRNALLPDCEEY